MFECRTDTAKNASLTLSGRYKRKCEEKKQGERERIIREAGEARTEGEVWEFLRKVRKKGGRIEEGIGKEEWKEYFMELLGGVESRIVGGEGRRRGRGEEEEDIREGEVEEAIKRLKLGKAAGEDGIEGEVWKFGGRALRREIWEICRGVMRNVWGIGKRYFGNDYKRKEWLFDTLVWTVMGYGVEVWRWGERRKVEAMQERYIKWILGVDWVTPGYMVKKEVKREKLRMRCARRAWRFVERLREGRGSGWSRECLKEIEERGREVKDISSWEKERKSFIESWGRRGDGREVVRRGERRTGKG
ncbi:hypothetical protein X777_09583 [Ooceraea biroi]|uniref:Uncharacterized protein n=1 Tax=Ooceraea biroi TaxID=2015173 RepID=A0A026W757_OOCBI|nr:hypothetical protein X777_09583 [Ooceraea biroi]